MHALVDQGKGQAGDFQSGDDAVGLGDEVAAHGRFGGNGAQRGDVSIAKARRADVFVEGALDNRLKLIAGGWVHRVSLILVYNTHYLVSSLDSHERNSASNCNVVVVTLAICRCKQSGRILKHRCFGEHSCPILPFAARLHSLSHPISIVALIVLLLNDHLWRRVAPSWLTGKIGDFAWLIFAPFLLAALLAWVWPKRNEFVGRLSIIGVGVIFGLAKTVPAFHTLTIDVLEFLTRWPNILRLDPTDLLALPALLIAGWIWERSATRSVRLPYRGWVLLPLAMLATMADSGMPFAGLNCLWHLDDQILVSDIFGSYISRDAGLSWTENSQTGDAALTSAHGCESAPSEIFNPDNPLVRFRLTSDGRQIERTEDGGRTWQTEYVKTELSQAQEVYARRMAGRGFPVLAGPMAAILDTTTGNLIVTAGHQGVVVRTLDGAWHAIGVGPYQPIDFHQPGMVVVLLSNELLLALVVFAMAIGTMAPDIPSRLTRVLLVLGWLALFGTLGFAMMFSQGDYSQLSSLGAIGAGVIAAPVAAVRLVAAFRLSPRVAWFTIGLSALTALLFVVPFVVWSQNGIPYYSTAAVYATVLGVVACIAGRRYLQRYLQTST